jgi:hypothetical protein
MNRYIFIKLLHKILYVFLQLHNFSSVYRNNRDVAPECPYNKHWKRGSSPESSHFKYTHGGLNREPDGAQSIQFHHHLCPSSFRTTLLKPNMLFHNNESISNHAKYDLFLVLSVGVWDGFGLFVYFIAVKKDIILTLCCKERYVVFILTTEWFVKVMH